MALSGNKGEWSEIYTLLKVIGDKQLYAGDSRLNKIAHLVFPIIKVLREESHGTYTFSYEDDLVVINRHNETCRLPIVAFQKKLPNYWQSSNNQLAELLPYLPLNALSTRFIASH